jgi:hypothetical protein
MKDGVSFANRRRQENRHEASRQSQSGSGRRTPASGQYFRQTRRSRFPNFFGSNALISPDPPKNKFGKIWRAKESVVENKGVFLEPR